MTERAIRNDRETSAAHVWLVLWKAWHAIERNALRSIVGTGLGFSDFAVLEALLHKGAQPVNVIGRRVLLTSGSITAAIDRLEAKRLVRRVADSADKRARVVQLTGAGRQAIRAAFARHAADLEQTLAVLNSAERRELVRLLRKAGLWAEARLEGPLTSGTGQRSAKAQRRLS
jgi:MarR family transcriptional regulator, 2-MHQ and catechol-resistance regulon repressor